MIRPVFTVFVKRLDGSEGYLMRRYGGLTQDIPKLFSKKCYAEQAAAYEAQKGSPVITISEFLLEPSAPDIQFKS